MKLIINASTLSGTGVTQVAVSFITECICIPKNEYHVFLSDTVASQIKAIIFPSNFFFYNIDSHPLYGIKGFFVRKKLKKLEKEINPDCVFSVFGPSWWTPKKPHLIGYAYPHYVYPDSPYFSHTTQLDKLKIKLFKTVHVFFLKRNGRYFVTETKDVSNRLVKLLKSNEDNIYTASNTYNDYFNTQLDSSIRLLPQKKNDEFRFLSLCSFAAHKNLLILNKVIPLLKESKLNKNVKFVLTVDPVTFDEYFDDEVKKSIINLGRIDVELCPNLYQECDALFLPTVLECLSANYPESMKMRRPILTSNLSFATSICGNAALYFDPYDEENIVLRIIEICNNPDVYNELLNHGEKQLSLFMTSKQRAEKYINICEDIIKKSN